MTGKEYLEHQVHPFDKMDVSTLTYPEEDFVRCPFCGKRLETDFEDGRFTIKRCDCENSYTEVTVINQIKEINKKISELEDQRDVLKESWETRVYEFGTKLAAKHYNELKPQRDAFDSEIEELAN